MALIRHRSKITEHKVCGENPLIFVFVFSPPHRNQDYCANAASVLEMFYSAERVGTLNTISIYPSGQMSSLRVIYRVIYRKANITVRFLIGFCILLKPCI